MGSVRVCIIDHPRNSERKYFLSFVGSILWRMIEKYTVAEGDTERGELVTTTFYSLRRRAVPPSRAPRDESFVGLTEPTHTRETTNAVVT